MEYYANFDVCSALGVPTNLRPDLVKRAINSSEFELRPELKYPEKLIPIQAVKEVLVKYGYNSNCPQTKNLEAALTTLAQTGVFSSSRGEFKTLSLGEDRALVEQTKQTIGSKKIRRMNNEKKEKLGPFYTSGELNAFETAYAQRRTGLDEEMDLTDADLTYIMGYKRRKDVQRYFRLHPELYLHKEDEAQKVCRTTVERLTTALFYGEGFHHESAKPKIIERLSKIGFNPEMINELILKFENVKKTKNDKKSCDPEDSY